MKKQFLLALATLSVFVSQAQKIDKLIDSSDVARIEKTLSSDDMQGRKTFSPGIDKAAEFIASEFKKAGIQPLQPGGNYFQEFTVIKLKYISAKGNLDGAELDPKDIVAFTTEAAISFDQNSGYKKIKIAATDTFQKEAFKILRSEKENVFVIVDTSQAKNFARLIRFKGESFKMKNNLVFVLSEKDPTNYSIEVHHEISEMKLKNVVGMIPGKSRKEEYVIFSGHYDHLGIGKPNANQDSIYNGANDDAAGTTAVITLAKYFAKVKNNERSLIFAAFTAEEIGGYGSRYFSQQFDPAKVMAMFNIEMIGTESKWGTNSAYITGFEKTDMGKILDKNLEGTQFKFYPDPYTTEQLFYRSDNATLARQGVPAHTISTSKMDSEKFYHTQEDEFETLDIKNMTEIIKAIALSSGTIISGKDTPTRVDTSQLR
ncbi:MAG: aminopeptidase [Bacteroidetes bacterium]|nr:MAG: aminopeptidase [Bacteroidota bacterium]